MVKRLLFVAIIIFAVFHKVNYADIGEVTVDVQFTFNRESVPTCIISLKKEGSVIGTATFNYNTVEKTAFLVQIGLTKDFQRLGYGTLLWDKMIEESKKLNIHKINFTAVPQGLDSMHPEWNERLEKLVAWYQKKGAKIIKIEDGTPFMEVNLISDADLSNLLINFQNEITALYHQIS